MLWQRVATAPARAGSLALLAIGVAWSYARNLHGPPLLAGAAAAVMLSWLTGE